MSLENEVLVTGAAGSVGSLVVEALVSKGHRVRAFDLPTVDFARLMALPGVEIVRGDITRAEALEEAVAGVEAVVHLAAVLPPASERNPKLARRVNLEGTEKLISALKHSAPRAHLVFSSSVSTYGDTWAEAPPIRGDHAQRALDCYAETKILAERAVEGSGLPYTILRISGIAVPALLAPPEPWPFMREQRIEFVARDDVVRALLACVEKPGVRDKTHNVAGGPSWQMKGYEYVARFNTLVGLDREDARYLDRPGYYDWYDTEEGQALLGYQAISFEEHLRQMQEAISRALGYPQEDEEE